MSEKKFSPEFQGTLQLFSALMGLSLAFKEEFGDEAVKVTQAFVERMGIRMGNQFKEKAGVKGSGIRDVERVVHAWLGPALAPDKPKTSVEDKKMTLARESPTMCPPLLVAKQMNLPPEMVCNTLSLPMFRGIAKAVNPKAKLTSQISEQKCVDIIEIP